MLETLPHTGDKCPCCQYPAMEDQGVNYQRKVRRCECKLRGFHKIQGAFQPPALALRPS